MRLKSYATPIILWGSPLLAVLLILLSVQYGAKDIDTGTIYEAVFHFDPGNVNHQIIMHSRFPRVIGALLIGAFLAISGALMQGMTRNDLASLPLWGCWTAPYLPLRYA